MRTFTKAVIGAAAAGALAFSLAACSGSSSSDTGSASSPSASSTPTPVASIPELTGKMTQVTVDKGFLDALTSLGLTPGVVGTATLTDGVLSFPITGGNVDYYDPNQPYRPYVQGEIDHEGSGLSLSAGGTTVELTNFTIDPGTSKLYGDVSANGSPVVQQAFLFDLDGSTLKPLQTSGDTAILEGTTVHVSADAAALLNKTFNTDAVKEGLLVGVAKITVNTK
ncbi:hypothetical protein DVJ78_12560 [Humibacter sp. BT305]|uniref:Uncharacterized protein n=1 Tax=Cnuibacter physcomitrellae TaxID=1619308 RepID=A0A1X9LMP9_9MICO|nr:hypothetical protein [Cnuibacter physcomitrellae]ARJ05221.1 hypothetical protein B5808_08345 [Cnuibacter physcomitrellae]AXH36135.1 hypothetical protein DVJ78_12560 [Humibacter sp. BT305]MCS5498602.1 hypothetical protein [Cnuibacter physcomitrellae]GGI35215.1 hypothetical protein GCM10010988_02810 [Cnuibacter physcomitrellae]